MNGPTIIVLGNQKGGTGKSTVGMHVVVSLLRQGFKVATIDADAHQGTLSRYIQNRTLKRDNNPQMDLPIPDHACLFQSNLDSVVEAEAEEKQRLLDFLEQFSDYDYVVIDTPGSDNHLSRLGHSFADILITPLNDSFIDLDLLVRLNAEMTILKPSTYSEMVWEQRKQKAIRNKGSIEWIVLRNRVSSVQSRNKMEMEKILQALSKRVGFRYISGFGDRVIFRELFLSGLTLLDMRENSLHLSLSHIAAKQELARLMEIIENSKEFLKRKNA